MGGRVKQGHRRDLQGVERVSSAHLLDLLQVGPDHDLRARMGKRLLDEFVTKRRDRLVLGMIFSRQAMGQPLVGPPGLDPRLGAALREAFAEAMRDPQLITEAR